MYNLKVQAEKAIDTRTIKIIIDGEEKERTAKEEVNVVGNESDEKIYLRGLFLNTNKINCPTTNGVYYLSWKQNYIPIIIFIALVLMVFMPLANDGYETSERFVVFIVGGLLVKFLWNDLLILGRKIRLDKEEF